MFVWLSIFLATNCTTDQLIAIQWIFIINLTYLPTYKCLKELYRYNSMRAVNGRFFYFHVSYKVQTTNIKIILLCKYVSLCKYNIIMRFIVSLLAHGTYQQRLAWSVRGWVLGPQRLAKQSTAVAVRTTRPKPRLVPVAVQPAPAIRTTARWHAAYACSVRLDQAQHTVSW